MTPFRAWLAMEEVVDQPKEFASSNGPVLILATKAPALRSNDHQPVLIVPDTEENRRKLGMEEA